MGGGEGVAARFLDTALFSNSSAASLSNLVGSLQRRERNSVKSYKPRVVFFRVYI